MLIETANAALTELLATRFWATWCVHAEPGEVEAAVIKMLSPPLNIAHNTTHPHYRQLRALRAAFTERPSS